MITVKIGKSEDGKTLILTLDGHAGQAAAGQDIVCSAASILAYTTAKRVVQMAVAGKLKKKPKIRLDPGNITITCKPSRGHLDEAMQIYQFAEEGYLLIRDNHPQYLQISKFGKA